jgi:dihydropteroate synthase
VKDTFFSKKKVLNARGKILDLENPCVMGILNVTPDSFYEQSRSMQLDSAIEKVQSMMEEGAHIIDIGAASSRPGSTALSPEDEWSRLSSVLKALVQNFPKAVFSIDTYSSFVAGKAFDAGVHMVNDISGGKYDSSIMHIAKENNAIYIGMHLRGTPETMQAMAQYKNVAVEVCQELEQMMNTAYQIGIKDVVIDPGFGFAKTLDQNYALLASLQALNTLQVPLLVGVSRKSMIYKYLEITPAQALNGTTVLNYEALRQGANILRVHDVKEAKETIALYTKLKSS